MVISRFSVILVELDPTVGSEIQKTRPCLVISPDEMNKHISTLIVTPMTTKGRNYPTRVRCTFKGKIGKIVLDQVRTIDKSRVIKMMGRIDKRTQEKVCSTLSSMFSL